MDIPPQVQQNVLDGLVLDDNGQWVPIERMVRKEARFLSHLEHGQVMHNDQWVSIDEAKRTAVFHEEGDQGSEADFSPHADTKVIGSGATNTPVEKKHTDAAEATKTATAQSASSRQSETPASSSGAAPQRPEPTLSSKPTALPQGTAQKPPGKPTPVQAASAAGSSARGDWETAQSRRKRTIVIVTAGAGLAAAAAAAATFLFLL